MIENKIDRPLGATCKNGAKTLMPDGVTWGESDCFKLISKFSSEAAGIMKSTKAMDVGNGCIVQVTTQQRNPDGTFAVAEALTYVPGVTILDFQEDGVTVARYIRADKEAETLLASQENASNGES